MPEKSATAGADRMPPGTGLPPTPDTEVPSETVGVVTRLARYPVKSMGGERLEEVEIGARGLSGDREWAVYTADGGIGSGKTTRRFRRVDGLLSFAARLDGAVPVLDLPDGMARSADDPAAGELLSSVLGQPVALRRENATPHHDESPVHLITTASVRRLARLLGAPVDLARFRANIVLDVPGEDFVEDAWKGRDLALGDEVVLRIGRGMPRCVMVGLPQAGLGPDNRLLKQLARAHDLEFGLQATLVRGGLCRQGDVARFD
jgi:uncharacterized protein YcbX